MTSNPSPLLCHRDAVRKVLHDCNLASQFGRLLKKTRLLAGYAKPQHFVEALQDYSGVKFCERSIYRYEEGLHSPPVDFLVVASLLLSPELFTDLLTRALTPDVVGTFKLIHTPAPYDEREQLVLFSNRVFNGQTPDTQQKKGRRKEN